MNRSAAALVCSVLVLVMLSGCQSARAPVGVIGDRGKYHEVQRGETLYSIAFSYGLDFRDVASRNKIRPPYTIYPGQKIYLSPPTSTAARSKSSKPAISSRTAKQSTTKKQATTTASAPKTPLSSGQWQWPIKGEVIKPFSLDGEINKGIDISAKSGTPVNAAAAGVVVYAGGNLRGYGKLVIIKHDDRYLSAYGNNRTIRVKEGDKIRRGQTISEVGKTASAVEMLHFEIRRDGKPEDPLRHLPSR